MGDGTTKIARGSLAAHRMEWNMDSLDEIQRRFEAYLPMSDDLEKDARELPGVAAEFATLLMEAEYEEARAVAQMNHIKSETVIAYVEDPLQFTTSRHRNMQITEAVYRTRVEYIEAEQHTFIMVAIRRGLSQIMYAIDQKRAMLELLLGRCAGAEQLQRNEIKDR